PPSSQRLVDQLCEMLCLDRGFPAVQAAFEVEQASEVAAHEAVGARRRDRCELPVQHAAGDVGVLDGEEAAEAAAFLRLGEWHRLDAVDGPDQRLRLFADAEASQQMTRRMVG